MVYAASLNIPVKKALKKQAMQSNITKICSQMVIDPDTTAMDVVFFGPRDLNGPNLSKIQSALESKHPDICVIYIYEKESERDLIDCEYKRACKKIKDSIIVEAFEEFVGQHKIRSGKQKISSSDFEVPDSDQIGDVTAEVQEKAKYTRFQEAPATAEMEPGDDEIVEAPELDLPPIDTSVFTEPPVVPMDTDTSISDPLNGDASRIPEVVTSASIERSLERLNSFEDWGLFKEHLHKDSIVKELLNENTEYVGLVNMLDVLDKRIQAIFRDPALTEDMKFDQIKAIGLERSVVRAATNSLNVEKAISIITTIVLSAKRTVEEKIQSLDVALYKISTDKKAIMDTSYIDKAIAERTAVQLELLTISRGIVDLYKSIDNLVTEEILDLDKNLPSANAFINEMVKPIGTQIFTPQNTSALTQKLMQALQSNRLVASQLEDSVNAVIETLFALCEKDEVIIRYQQNLINLLQAHRVEDVVIVNSLLQQSLRLFTGADNSGRSATAITWSGILSRRQNSILVDLTGRAKFKDYGITPMSLEDFLTSRPEKQFLCVEADHKPSPEEIQDIVNELKSRLNYYPYINVIVAPEDELIIDQLSENAKCIYYITDCSTQSISVMKDTVKKHTTKNIARHLVTIDTPVSPLMIAESIGVKATSTRIIPIPNVPAVRACALRHDRPYEYDDVLRIYEEAFR